MGKMGGLTIANWNLNTHKWGCNSGTCGFEWQKWGMIIPLTWRLKHVSRGSEDIFFFFVWDGLFQLAYTLNTFFIIRIARFHMFRPLRNIWYISILFDVKFVLPLPLSKITIWGRLVSSEIPYDVGFIVLVWCSRIPSFVSCSFITDPHFLPAVSNFF